MRQWFWAVMGLCLACVGCTSPRVGMGNAYRPAILEAGVDGVRYETDRQDCEAHVQRSPSNYEPNNVIRFRQCLVDKGYRLLS